MDETIRKNLTKEFEQSLQRSLNDKEKEFIDWLAMKHEVEQKNTV